VKQIGLTFENILSLYRVAVIISFVAASGLCFGMGCTVFAGNPCCLWDFCCRSNLLSCSERI